MNSRYTDFPACIVWMLIYLTFIKLMVGSYHNNENNAGTMKVSVAFSRVSGEALIVSEVTPTEVLSVNYKELGFF